MKKIFFTAFITTLLVQVNAQNVGIGTATPTRKLDVAGQLRLQQSVTGTAGIYFDGHTLPERSFIGTQSDDYIGIYGKGGAGWGLLMNVNNGNMSIGDGTYPIYKLDLAGRMRIKNSAGTAGIYFDGLTLPIRSFIGTMNEDYVGLYGNGGAGWNFVMNVENGYTGIGTTTPTEKLDVNGYLRVRGGNPVAGAVLTASSSSGTAVWKPNKVGFSVRRAENVAVPHNTYTKIEFSNEEYDALNYFEPYTGTTTTNSSKFTAPVSGLYHFSAHFNLFMVSSTNNFTGAFIALVVNGENYVTHTGNPLNSFNTSEMDLSISSSVHLNAGDKVWIALRQLNEDGVSEGPGGGFTEQSAFSGHLVYAD